MQYLEAFQEVVDRIIQLELAFFPELHNPYGSEGLGNRPNTENRIRSNCLIGAGICQSKSFCVDKFAILDNP